jgi:hypothetical protein
VFYSLAFCLKSSAQLKLFKYILYLLSYGTQCDENLKKCENALLEKIFNIIFFTFFYFFSSQWSKNCSLENFYSKKSLHILKIRSKKCFTSKLLRYIKTFLTQKVFKIFQSFSFQCTGCVVR